MTLMFLFSELSVLLAPQRTVKFMAMRSEAHLTLVAPREKPGSKPADGTGARDIIINSQFYPVQLMLITAKRI
jgi:hypothetical protein